MRIFRTLSVAACLTISAASHAQFDEPEAHLIDVSYEGGTLGGFIDAIRTAAAPAPVNVVLPGGGAPHSLPAIDLRSVTLDTALRMIETLPAGGQKPAFRVAVLHDKDATPQAEPVYSIVARPEGPGVESISTMVFMIRDLIEARPDAGPTLSTDDILTALDVSVRATPTQMPPPRLHFHEDTGVLVVTGERPALSTAENLLDELRTDLDRRRSRVAQLERARAMEAEQAAALQIQLETTMVQMQEMQAIAEKLEASRAGGDASSGLATELTRLQDEVMQKREIVAATQLELAVLRGRLNERARHSQEPREYRFRADPDRVLEMLDALRAISPGIEFRPGDSGRAMTIAADDKVHALLSAIARLSGDASTGRGPGGGSGGSRRGGR